VLRVNGTSSRIGLANGSCLDASTDIDPRGVGVAHSQVHDERGPIGHSLQERFIDRLRVAPPSV
jgi:hypothetical protein